MSRQNDIFYEKCNNDFMCCGRCTEELIEISSSCGILVRKISKQISSSDISVLNQYYFSKKYRHLRCLIFEKKFLKENYHKNPLRYFATKKILNKKVLLRERKRHTARHVASTHYVVLSWLTPPGWT